MLEKVAQSLSVAFSAACPVTWVAECSVLVGVTSPVTIFLAVVAEIERLDTLLIVRSDHVLLKRYVIEMFKF